MMKRFALVVATLALAASAAFAGRTGDNESVWIHDNGNERFEIRVRGSADFSDDSASIVHVADGSSVYVEERSGGTTRSLTVRPGAGSLEYAYKMNGREAPFDADARAWLAGMLKRATAEGGFNLEGRIRHALATGGPEGLVEEIEKAKSDYVKTAMLDALFKAGQPDSRVAVRALRAASAFDSDYYRDQALSHFAGKQLSNAEARSLFFEAYARIGSDYYQNAVLERVALAHGGDAEILRQAADAAAKISGDYYKASALETIFKQSRGDASVRDAVLRVAKTIDSDYYRGQVLSKVY
jgi:hypothetical protein